MLLILLLLLLLLSESLSAAATLSPVADTGALVATAPETGAATPSEMIVLLTLLLLLLLLALMLLLKLPARHERRAQNALPQGLFKRIAAEQTGSSNAAHSFGQGQDQGWLPVALLPAAARCCCGCTGTGR